MSDLAREIADEYFSDPIRSKSELIEIIAAKIKPLVETIERRERSIDDLRIELGMGPFYNTRKRGDE